MIKIGSRCAIPYNLSYDKPLWETIDYDDHHKYEIKNGLVVVCLRSIFQYEKNGTKFIEGGYVDQPKIFWELLTMNNQVQNAYNKLELDCKNGK